MVKLREPIPVKSKTTRFVYDSKDIAKAKFIGTFDEYGEPSIKEIKGDPNEFLAALGHKNRTGFPLSTDIIAPHEIIIGNKTRFWFSYTDKKSLQKEKEKEESDRKKAIEAEVIRIEAERLIEAERIANELKAKEEPEVQEEVKEEEKLEGEIPF